MILPFSSSRSRTSFSSNCLYCASLTPRAMFSKSMNIASFRSPFIHVVLSSALLSLGGVGAPPLPLYVRRSGPPGRFMICHMKKPDSAVGARVPPGQALTEKWPVLPYGRTPRFDPNRWTFRCFGLVERPTSWTREEFLRLPRVTVRSDIHCVTRWSKLDNDWEGVSARYIVEEVKPRPEAKAVLQHADADSSTNPALADPFRGFEADAGARVAVLWGARGTFGAGADLKAIGSGRGSRLHPAGDGPMGPSRMLLSKPTIAAVAGYAVAGGLELALWCDLRVLEENAVLGVFCRRWGVPLVDGGTVRLPRLIGLSRALDLILTGRPVDAAEALAIGLANRVVAKGLARAAAEELAAEIAKFPQVTMRGDRQSAHESVGLSVDEAL